MEKSSLQVSGEIIDHIKREILPAVPVQIDQLSSESVDDLRVKLQVLRYYCLQKGLDSDITDRLDAMLETSQGFWELLEDNVSMLRDLKETYRMRRLDFWASLLVQIEEIISGEESVRDAIITSIATFIGWKSDTIWVDMAKKDQRLIAKSHLIRLKDELWRVIGESSRNGDEITLEKAAEVGEKMNQFLRVLAEDDMPPALRIMFLSQIYILLLRMNIGKVLMALEANHEDARGG